MVPTVVLQRRAIKHHVLRVVYGCTAASLTQTLLPRHDPLASSRPQERHAAVSLLADAIYASAGTVIGNRNAATLWASPVVKQLAGVLSDDVRGTRSPLYLATMVAELLSTLIGGNQLCYCS